MDLTPVTDLLAKVPGPAWGAIGGALLTLIPVIVSNRHSRKQQAQDHEFESRERQRDRHASLRRDVYLPAADAFTGQIAGMARLLNLEVSDDDIAERAQAFSASLTRIQMIASPETIKRVAELQREVVSTIGALQQKRHPMRIRQQQINVAAATLQRHEDQLEAFEHAAANLTSGRASSDDVARYTQAMFQTRHMGALRDEAHIDWLRLMLAQEIARADIAREFVRRMEALVSLQAPLLSAIRGELENDAALHLITEEAEKLNAVGVRAVGDMIPVIDRTIEAMRSDLAHYEQRRLAEAEQEQGSEK